MEGPVEPFDRLSGTASVPEFSDESLNVSLCLDEEQMGSSPCHQDQQAGLSGPRLSLPSISGGQLLCTTSLYAESAQAYPHVLNSYRPVTDYLNDDNGFLMIPIDRPIFTLFRNL